ncbi:MAG: 30S ribosomal protein S20 [Bdellovibrionales bacterium]|nr:30S ribosomal protein S20 [Bdellovibrionales bacterium]
MRSSSQQHLDPASTNQSVRTFEKKLRTAIASGDKKAAEQALREYMSKAQKAATKGVMHAKTAARKLSRISKQASKTLSK